MTRTQRGLTLIEITIVVAVAGILATVGVPSYRDHSMREKVAQAIAQSVSAKATIEEYARAHGRLPPTTAVALPFVASNYVASTAWTASGPAGTVIVSMRSAGRAEERDLDAKAIGFTASYDPKSHAVDWRCGDSTTTTVSAKYLPSDCR